MVLGGGLHPYMEGHCQAVGRACVCHRITWATPRAANGLAKDAGDWHWLSSWRLCWQKSAWVCGVVGSRASMRTGSEGV